MNKEQNILNDFSFSELQMLLEHVRLGSDHLKLLLTAEQYQELLKWCNLNKEQKEKMVSDKAEKTGTMALIINTVLTSTFGAWMGLSSCMGCSLGSFRIFIIISFIAFLVSGLIGYISLKFTKHQVRQALNVQKLHNLQLHILHSLNYKLNQKIENEENYLNTAVFLLEQEKELKNNFKSTTGSFDNALEAFEWLENFRKALKSRLEQFNETAALPLYWSELSKIINRLRKIFAKHIHFVEHITGIDDRRLAHQQNTSHFSFLKILTDPAYAIPKYQSFSSSWIQGNFSHLIIGLVPTIWGGFASMFVFVGGIPNILRDLGFSQASELLIQPLARWVELALAIAITIYFGFSYIYQARKFLQRKLLLDKTQKEITNEEAHFFEKNHKLQLLFKVKAQIQKIIAIFNIFKKIDYKISDKEIAQQVNLVKNF